METTLSISCEDLSSDILQRFVFEINRELNAEGMVSKIPEKPASPGGRGDMITTGQLVLTALSSGTVVALFNCIKPFFERKSSLKMAFERKDGAKLVIEGDHLNRHQIDQAVKTAKEFFGDQE
jgi:hypothetical protein